MKAQIKVLSGTISGQITVYSEPTITIGRHPDSDLQFDPENELEVSGRHAVITVKDNRWLIQDSGSMNGTLVNGHKISADTALGDTDQIRFGANGPLVEFRLVPDSTPDGIIQPAVSEAPASQQKSEEAQPYQKAEAKSVDDEPRESTTQRIRIEVKRRTKRHRVVTLTLFVILLGVAAAFLYDRERQQRIRDAEIAAIEARTDSMMLAATEAMEALEGQVEGLGSALRESQTEVGMLRNTLVAAEEAGSSEEAERLRLQLADAMQALRYREAAAHVDYGSIVDANQRAIALVWADLGSGNIQIGTAFAVDTNGTMVTCRHVVAGEDGTIRPSRIGIQFADSWQVFEARLLAVSSEVDLAVVKVNIRGGVPKVQRLNLRRDTVSQGDPVATIGFPLGTSLPMTEAGRSRTIARTTFNAGTASKVLPDLIQIDGYGAQGASGSPIFDRNGEVVSVLYGGEPGSSGRIVLSVPSSYVVGLLESIQ